MLLSGSMHSGETCSDEGGADASSRGETVLCSGETVLGFSGTANSTATESRVAVSAAIIAEVLVRMAEDGWLVNPLEPSKKRERSTTGGLTTGTATTTPEPDQDKLEAAKELLRPYWGQVVDFILNDVESDQQQWHTRIFGDWCRAWKEPELPYLAAYGRIGTFDGPLTASAIDEDGLAADQVYSSNEDDRMADAGEEVCTRARPRRQRRHRLACRVVEIGSRRGPYPAHKRSASWSASVKAPSRFPTHWSKTDKAIGIDLEKNTDRPCRAYYVGPGKLDTDAAAVRANMFIPTEVCVYYYEMKVVSAGAEGFIGLGLCAGDVALERLPGWEKNSIGYHGDDGHIFRDSGVGSPYGPTYTTGDTVGCCWNCITGEVFFTKEGTRLKRAFRNVRPTRPRPGVELAQGNRSTSSSSSSSASGGSGEPSTASAMVTATAQPWLSRYEGWYPVIGMRTVGEIVEANFGQKPFLFDIEAYVQEQVAQFLNSIVACQTEQDADQNSSVSLEEHHATQVAVLDYLLTEGYVDTAAAFARTAYPECFAQRFMDTTSVAMRPEAAARHRRQREELEEALTDAKLRASIMDCIQRGRLEEASALGQERYPDLFGPSASILELNLQADEAMLDKQLAVVLLQCQRLVEMIHRLKENPYQDHDALQYTYERLWPLLSERSAEPGLARESDQSPPRDRNDLGSTFQGTPNRDCAHGQRFVVRRDGRKEAQRRLIRLFILQHMVLLAYPDLGTLSVAWLQKRRGLVAAALNRAMLLERPRRARPSSASPDAASYLVRMMQHLNTVMEVDVEHGAGIMALVQAKDLW